MFNGAESSRLTRHTKGGRIRALVPGFACPGGSDVMQLDMLLCRIKGARSEAQEMEFLGRADPGAVFRVLVVLCEVLYVVVQYIRKKEGQ